MERGRFGLSGILFVLFFVSNSSALEFDFVLNETSQSYRSSFTDPTEKTYMDLYMARSAQNIETLFDAWPNTFAMIGNNLPPLGKPHLESGFGLCLGSGDCPAVDRHDVGLRLFDAGLGCIADLSLFATLSTDRILRSPSRGFWRDTDITVKFNNFVLIGFEDVRVHFSNIGLMGRKQMVSGIPLLGKWIKLSGVSLSLGLQYSTLTGREDDIGNGFYNDIGTSEPPEVVIVDENIHGTIAVGAPASPALDSFVHYPYVEFSNLSICADIKGYMNLLHFLDVFLGTGLVIAPYNRFFADVSSDVNVRISDDQGLDSNYDGRLTVIGTGDGRHLMPTLLVGFQLNLGPVKIPIQLSGNLPTENRSVNAGLYLSF